MEADVALHAPEAWVTSADPRTEKMKYVYSNRRKEREGKSGRKSSSSRIQQMKPSRSYDNEMESRITKEAELSRHMASSSAYKVKDDSSLKYASEKVRSSPMTGASTPPLASSPFPKLSHSGSYGYSHSRTKPPSPDIHHIHRDIHSDEGGGRGGRWRPRNRTNSKGKPPIGDGSARTTHSRRTLEKQHSFPETEATAISPVASANPVLRPSTSVDDQLQQVSARPKITALDLQSEHSAAGYKGSSQGIVLEVKHSPTLHFKPSDTMLSDSSSLGCWRANVDHTNLYDPDERPLPALRGRRPPATSEENEPVKSPDFDDLPIKTRNQRRAKSSKSESAVSVSSPQIQTSLSIPQMVKHDDIVVGSSSTSSSHYTSHFDALPHGQGTPAFSSFGVLQDVSEETAFSSPSIIFQQKAGIRHDDMIVGPVSRLPPVDPHRPTLHDTDNKSEGTSSGIVPGLPSVSHQTASQQSALPLESCSNKAKFSTAPPYRDEESSEDKEYSRRKVEVGGDKKLDVDVSVSNSKICDSPPAARSIVKMKEGERKPRGSSPGSGIPVRRGAGDSSGGERSRDRFRGTSPIIGASSLARHTDTTSASSPNVSEDIIFGSSQSLPTAVGENVRWRPRDKKSGGTHRMRREGKKEKNVSTESGYVTDHAFYSEMADTTSGFSPEHGKDCYFGERAFHPTAVASAAAPGSLDRKSRHSHSKHVPSSPSARSKSACTTPVKKAGNLGSSKGQPLSSIPIPVPISHDERNRKPSAKSPEPMGLPLQKDSTIYAVGEGRKMGIDSLESVSQGSNPSAAATPDSLESNVRGYQMAMGPTKSRATATSLPSSSLASSSTSSLPAATVLSLVPSSASSSSAVIAPQLSSSSSAVKPRLHRSAEHLLASTKLAIYRGPDDGDQPDSASDISVATACSMPVKTVTQPPDIGDSVEKARAKAMSSDLVDRSGVSKRVTPAKGRCVSLLRREKERSTAIVRRGSDRAVPVDRNDPSAVGLKAATSLKELCQSMASLLNIDNEKAAEMLSTSLSKRQDLVEGLDADAILDYLTHHGVLDPSVLVGLGDGGEATNIQRNSVILRHVEEHGDTAVALFINALRQSGQLHLASSLDTEQRIKPVSGNSYFGKSRHKGEICVRLEVEALKILAPREPTERNVNLSLLSSPSHDGPTVLTDDEDDQVKPKSCWCFCISRKRKSSRSSSSKKRKGKNKYKDSHQNQENYNGHSRDSSLPPPDYRLQPHGLEWDDSAVTPHRTKSVDRGNNSTSDGASGSNVSSSSLPSTPHRSTPARAVMDKKKNNKKSKHKSSGKPDVPATIQESDMLQTVPEVAFRSGARESARKKSGAKPMPIDLQLTPAGQNSDPWKRAGMESSDGIIMEYDAHLELVKLRAGHDELASPTRQAGPVGILVEQWKCSGKHYLAKAEMLCQAIMDQYHTDIIKYFEQDRGTLVLDVISEGTAIVVFNICMTKAQVKRLQEEHENGALLEKLQELFTSKVELAKFDIRGVQYRTVVDESQLQSVLSELS